jgi:hypothetical protein
MRNRFLLALAFIASLSIPTMTKADTFDDATARFAGLALKCVHQEYPNKIAHVLSGPEDARTP